MKIPVPVSTNIIGWARAVTRALTDFTGQEVLVSGSNIKTVNGNTLLGAGDVVITGGNPAMAWVI